MSKIAAGTHFHQPQHSLAVITLREYACLAFGNTSKRKWRLSAQNICLVQSALNPCSTIRSGVWRRRKYSRGMKQGPARLLGYHTDNRRFDILTLRRTLESDRDFRWCLRSGCGSGQIQLNPSDPLMVCQVCKYWMCFEHRVPWHTDYTCEEYNQRDDIDEVRSKELLACLPVQKCPGPECPYYVEKIGGCNIIGCIDPCAFARTFVYFTNSCD